MGPHQFRREFGLRACLNLAPDQNLPQMLLKFSNNSILSRFENGCDITVFFMLERVETLSQFSARGNIWVSKKVVLCIYRDVLLLHIHS